jgi:small-conductance mechanosensitive channel
MGAMWDWITQHWDDQWAKFAEGILLLLLGFVIASLVRRWLRNELKRPHIDPQVALLVSRIVYLAIVLLGVIAFFTRWLSNPTLVFGSFGFGALALSLAFQDILKNFIAGMFLLVERPFRLGDEITVDNHTGLVENVQVRTTTLRTTEGEQVLVPNSLVYTGTIINRTRYPTRLFTLTAKVPEGAALDGLVERLREQVASRPDIAKDPPPHIGLQPAIDGGLTLEVRYWLDYRRNDPLAVQASLGQEIYRAIHAPAPPSPATKSAKN